MNNENTNSERGGISLAVLPDGRVRAARRNDVRQAGAEVVGCGVLVEKRYQGGGDFIRAQGVRVEALARIESMSVENGLVFS